MPTGRHSKGQAADDPGLTRRRFLRAAGVGTAGAMVAAGAVVGQAGAQVEGAAVPGGSAPKIPARRDVVRVGGQRTAAAAAALAVSGPLSLHTISPQRYLDTRFDGGGPFPPQGGGTEFFIFDFGDPDYFSGVSPMRSRPRPGRSPATSPSPAAPRAATCVPSPATAT